MVRRSGFAPRPLSAPSSWEGLPESFLQNKGRCAEICESRKDCPPSQSLCSRTALPGGRGLDERTCGQVGGPFFNPIFLPADLEDYSKRVLQLLGRENPVPSDEELRVYENKVTPLHFQVVQGGVERVRLLLAHEAGLDCQTACGSSPLLLATQDQQPDLRALLLEHGADANLADEDGWAPLHFAAQNGDDRTARLLLDHGAHVDAREHEGWTPLHLAAQNNFENVARLLVSRQADPNLHEAEGKTPLHVAAYLGHVSLVKLLTGQGAELDAQQRNLRTPLHLAVERGKVRAIQHLPKSGAAPDALDRRSYSPLHLAAAGEST